MKRLAIYFTYLVFTTMLLVGCDINNDAVTNTVPDNNQQLNRINQGEYNGNLVVKYFYPDTTIVKRGNISIEFSNTEYHYTAQLFEPVGNDINEIILEDHGIYKDEKNQLYLYDDANKYGSPNLKSLYLDGYYDLNYQENNLLIEKSTQSRSIEMNLVGYTVNNQTK